jgi:hypothetical protein
MTDEKTPDSPPGFSEAAPEPGSDHAYEIWVRRKIERALKRSLENPDNHVPQDEVWRKFGLER